MKYYTSYLRVKIVILLQKLFGNRPKLILAFDFDGTIVKSGWPKVGPLRKGARLWFRWMSKRRHITVLNTCRSEKLTKEAVDSMWQNDIKFSLVNENHPLLCKKFDGDTRKISADWYFDDKGGFLGWWSVPLIVLWLEWKYRKGGNLLG